MERVAARAYGCAHIRTRKVFCAGRPACSVGPAFSSAAIVQQQAPALWRLLPGAPRWKCRRSHSNPDSSVFPALGSVAPGGCVHPFERREELFTGSGRSASTSPLLNFYRVVQRDAGRSQCHDVLLLFELDLGCRKNIRIWRRSSAQK